jgi:hypothetical protein
LGVTGSEEFPKLNPLDGAAVVVAAGFEVLFPKPNPGEGTLFEVAGAALPKLNPVVGPVFEAVLVVAGVVLPKLNPVLEPVFEAVLVVAGVVLPKLKPVVVWGVLPKVNPVLGFAEVVVGGLLEPNVIPVLVDDGFELFTLPKPNPVGVVFVVLEIPGVEGLNPVEGVVLKLVVPLD